MTRFGFVTSMALCIVALAATGVWANQTPPPRGPVAKVNGQEITREAWEQALQRLPPIPVHFSEAQRKSLHTELLGLMVDELLLRQFLQQHSAAPAASQIDQRLAELEKSLKARQMTLQEFLVDSKQTLDQLRSGIGLELQWQNYLTQRLAQVDLKDYYEKNKEMFDGVVIRVSHVVVPLPPRASSKDEEAARAKLLAIQKEISQGLDFAEAAKKYSQDGTAVRGGDLGYFPPRRSESDPFIRSASHLKVGQVSDVVRTDFGMHLIKVTDRKEGSPSDYEAIKDTVRAVYGDELRIQVIQDQRKTAKIEVYLP